MSQIMEQAVVLIREALEEYSVSIDNIHCNGECGDRISVIPPDSTVHILYDCGDDETAKDAAERIIEDVRSGNTLDEVTSAFRNLLCDYVEKYDSEEEIIEAMKKDFGFNDLVTSD